MSTTSPTIDLDAEVARYAELGEMLEQLSTERAQILDRLRDALPVGKHATSFGLAVTVAAPSRVFNLTKAWGLLNAEQQRLCVKPDPAKVKGQLPGTLVETLMETPANGRNGVSVK